MLLSEHSAKIQWQRTTDDFVYETFSRDHSWSFDFGATIPASAVPPIGSGNGIDPEEALAAALSSCHMMTVLAIAAKKRMVIDAYEDEPVAKLVKGEDGKISVPEITIRPKITFGSDPLDQEKIERLHESAHRNCFIANSIKCKIVIEPQF